MKDKQTSADKYRQLLNKKTKTLAASGEAKQKRKTKK